MIEIAQMSVDVDDVEISVQLVNTRKKKRHKRIRHKLDSAGFQVGENELQLTEPASKINSFQHCILESLFFFYYQRLQNFVVSG